MGYPTYDLTFEKFQRINAERCRDGFKKDPSDWTEEQWACAIAGEAGELCNLIKKCFRGDFTVKEKRQEIIEELVDVITYCDLMLTKMGANTESELILKFNKVSKRRNCDVLL